MKNREPKMESLRAKIEATAQRRAFVDRKNPACAWRGPATGNERECPTCSGHVRQKTFECGRGLFPDGAVATDCVDCAARFTHQHRPFSSLDIALSTRCNLRCPFCYLGQGGHQEKPNLAKAIHYLKWFLAQALPIPVERERVINIYGGEPLLEWDTLVKFIEEGRRLSQSPLRFSVITNGTLLTEERYRWMLKNGVRPQLSIDGCPTVQNAQRITPSGGGTSRVIEQVLRMVLKHNRNTTVRATVTPEAVPYLVESVKYLHEGFGVRSIMAVAASGYAWGPADLDAYEEALYGLADYVIEQATATPPTFLKLYPFERGCRGLLDAATEAGHQGCGAGRSMVAIDMDGVLWPCHRFAGGDPASQWSLGSVSSGVTNRLFKSALEQVDCREHARPECARCSAQLSCIGHCCWESMQTDGATSARYPFPQGRLPHACRMQKDQTAAWQYLHRTLARRGILHYGKGHMDKQFREDNLANEKGVVTATITNLGEPMGNENIDGAVTD